MFKKIYEKIDTLSQMLINNFRIQCDEHYDTRKTVNHESSKIMAKFDSMSKIITSQQRTIEQLTNALKDKYEHGLFILSDDGTNFIVIKNGEEIANERVAYCRVTWAPGEAVSVETEYRV